ncbi:MAG: glutamate racemase [Omnitrophica WOR_2 bacterium RIFCSPHIGHO2_02_FULL_68_15]|nr:MAG: glutamate racemase [Omnitrophica WOR_2 bacterium RIFCSPHIGHO2_02_FULL_68_15]
MASPTSPIGVFDSGIGGLTVVRELFRALPHEAVLYFGDTARVPYGNKSRETIVRFSTENVLFLLHHDVKLIIIACNTASSHALPFLERSFSIPLVGVIEPGVQAAVAATRTKRIGVIGTAATVGSGAYERALRRVDPAIRVTSVGCPLFVPLVEEGWTARPVAKAIAAEYLAPLVKAKVDTLILGCTHYPLLKPMLRQVLGPKVQLVDSAAEVAQHTKVILQHHHLLNATANGGRPAHRYFVSDESSHFTTLGSRFLGRTVGPVTRVAV